MNRISVKTPDKRDYEIVLNRGFEGILEELSNLSLKDRRALIVTDKNVAPLYLNELSSALKNGDITSESYILEPGEESKTQESAMAIMEKLIEGNYKRTDMVIALGGFVS